MENWSKLKKMLILQLVVQHLLKVFHINHSSSTHNAKMESGNVQNVLGKNLKEMIHD